MGYSEARQWCRARYQYPVPSTSTRVPTTQYPVPPPHTQYPTTASDHDEDTADVNNPRLTDKPGWDFYP